MSHLISLIHGTSVVIEVMEKLVREACPDCEIIHILDEGLLLRLMKTVSVTPEIRRDFCSLVVSAEKAGAEIALVTGSSFSTCVDIARQMVTIPVLKIDEPMAAEAVRLGSRIGIVATETTTLGPSTELIRQKALQAGKDVSIQVLRCEGASELLRHGNHEEFDQAIASAAEQIAGVVDVIVLAQVSLARALPEVRERVGIPVLASPELAVKELARMVAKLVD